MAMRPKMMDEIYGWFLHRRCELWNQAGPDGQCCPILEKQRVNYREIPRESAVYYPESIFGNPSSSIIFLGINPGQSELKPKETNREKATGRQEEIKELVSCPNSQRNWNMGLEAYIQHHLHYNLEHPKEKVIAGAVRILRETWGCSNDVALSMLTFMNVAHCKCPNYDRHFRKMKPPQGFFWNRCGVQTLKVLSILKPKAVVCMGGPVQYWVEYVHGASSPQFYAPWKLDCDLEAKWYGRTMPLVNTETKLRIPLVMSYHTANWGKFNAGIDVIVGQLRGILFGK